VKYLFLVISCLISLSVRADCGILLAATTSASQSNSVMITPSSNSYNATFVMYAASGLSATEYGDLQISHDGGTTWQDVYQDGSQIRLNSTNNVETVFGTGRYRVDMDTQTNAAGIWLCKDTNL